MGRQRSPDCVMDAANEYDELRCVEGLLDALDDDLESNDSKFRYLSDVRQFYTHLVDCHGSPFNPAETVDHEELWKNALKNEKDNPTLSSE
ncbi:hypothetical protein D8Y22_02095 [Salinadaptatus halalkaliphilus]|uniref:Uncharacterized protein n=1 Tax=Salinadaptatus halalkaliphilus TaxID=2419781 RepID=A0A4S3TS08_9EURY|nr:hypothetical protein [Salinadaptatus halalkaliphilus]THE66470.1 hypothetical protein D8Y22_02095 [Salinadaptatus halalkaliphilus]